jgi:hypothetical protein
MDRRRWRGRVVAGILAGTSTASAQPGSAPPAAEPTAPTPTETAESAARPADDAAEQPDTPGEEGPSSEAGKTPTPAGEGADGSATPPAQPEAAEAPATAAPPLPHPTPDDQQPRPVAGEAEPDAPLRNVDIGPDAGIWARPAQGNTGVTYSAGFSWGAHARLEIAEWLGVRALVNSTRHGVSVDRGALGPTPETELDQPALRVVYLAAQLEPTWLITPRLRVWGGLGAGWATVEAPAPKSKDDSELRSARRTGVYLDLLAALGITFDVVRDWMTASVSVTGGAPVNQSGAVFRRVQVLQQNPPAQEIQHYEALPKFAGSVSILAGLGILL